MLVYAYGVSMYGVPKNLTHRPKILFANTIIYILLLANDDRRRHRRRCHRLRLLLLPLPRRQRCFYFLNEIINVLAVCLCVCGWSLLYVLVLLRFCFYFESFKPIDTDTES